MYLSYTANYFEKIYGETFYSEEVDLLNSILERIEKEKKDGGYSASYYLPLFQSSNVSYERICSCLSKLHYDVTYFERADQNCNIYERVISIHWYKCLDLNFFKTAEEVRKIQEEYKYTLSESESLILKEIIDKAVSAAKENKNKIVFNFNKNTTYVTYDTVNSALEKLGYKICLSHFGNDLRNEWYTFIEISW